MPLVMPLLDLAIPLCLWLCRYSTSQSPCASAPAPPGFTSVISSAPKAQRAALTLGSYFAGFGGDRYLAEARASSEIIS